jgi:hypothetical protein
MIAVVATLQDLEDLVTQIRDGKDGFIKLNGEATNIYIQKGERHDIRSNPEE